jgi:PTS system nitrogen regulatory IIA component
MQIESLLTPTRTLCHVTCSSKKRSLEVLASLIAEGSENINADELFQQLVARERLGSTGIGEGIAIPALMTLAKPIDFDSVDGRPVDVIFAMLVPENAENEHLQTLAMLAERLQDPQFVQSLRRAETGDDLYRAAIEIDV